MERVAVIGCGGSGKSTFADRLGRRLGIEVVHLDRLHWRPGWVPTPDDEWRRLQLELVAGDRWIIDGNYGSSLDVRLARADTVVFFDLPRWRCLLGVVRRWARHRGREIQARGCPEHWDWRFLAWVWRYRRHSRPATLDAIASHAAGARILVITSRRAASEALGQAR